MREPYLSEFKRLIRSGAASQDVHDVHDVHDVDAGGFASAGAAAEAFVTREVDRVGLHLQSLTPPLERAIGRAPRVLDFGCGTGGTTIALALSALGVEEVVGVDASPRAVRAAEVRAAGHDVAPRVRFVHVAAGARLPFGDGAFDLVTTVSVLEFITDPADRDRVVAELRRLVRPGGHLYIATPRVGLREYHSGRLLGDFVRRPGMPWSSTPRQTARWTRGWQRVAVVPRQLRWLPGPLVEPGARLALAVGSDWQKILLRRPG